MNGAGPLSTSSSTASNAIAARAQRRRYVVHFDAHALVLQRMTGQRPQRAAVPFDDGGEQFRDDDGCVRRQEIERGAQRKTHAQSADENATARPGSARLGTRASPALPPSRASGSTSGSCRRRGSRTRRSRRVRDSSTPSGVERLAKQLPWFHWRVFREMEPPPGGSGGDNRGVGHFGKRRDVEAAHQVRDGDRMDPDEAAVLSLQPVQPVELAVLEKLPPRRPSFGDVG